MWGIIVDNALGFAVGLVCGFFLARALIFLEVRVAHDETGPEPAQSPPHWVRMVVYFMAAVVLFGTGVYTGFKVLEGKYNCLDQYASENAEAANARSAAADQRDDSEVRTWQAILAALKLPPGKATPEEEQAFEDAIEAHVEQIETLQRKRIENPYPEPPREVC